MIYCYLERNQWWRRSLLLLWRLGGVSVRRWRGWREDGGCPAAAHLQVQHPGGLGGETHVAVRARVLETQRAAAHARAHCRGHGGHGEVGRGRGAGGHGPQKGGGRGGGAADPGEGDGGRGVEAAVPRPRPRHRDLADGHTGAGQPLHWGHWRGRRQLQPLFWRGRRVLHNLGNVLVLLELLLLLDGAQLHLPEGELAPRPRPGRGLVPAGLARHLAEEGVDPHLEDAVLARVVPLDVLLVLPHVAAHRVRAPGHWRRDI